MKTQRSILIAFLRNFGFSVFELLGGENHYATVHIVAVSCNTLALKDAIRHEFLEHGVAHVTIELEQEGEPCRETKCKPHRDQNCSHYHHH